MRAFPTPIRPPIRPPIKFGPPISPQKPKKPTDPLHLLGRRPLGGGVAVAVEGGLTGGLNLKGGLTGG